MEIILYVLNAMFWVGVGIILKSCGDWLCTAIVIKDGELLHSFKKDRVVFDTTKDGKK